MIGKGDQVIYGIHGVCNVVAEETKSVDSRLVTYLVLEPAGQSGSRYLVPTHNTAAMAKLHRILSREELETLLQSPEVRADGWISDESRRKQAYRELISCGDRIRLMQMIHALYVHREAQLAAGRKCHLSDENFLRDAERLLCGEISVVLGMDMGEARQYLREKLK